ncbi:PaaI family thioesterase (plasmid) [Phyllobacterium sp. 628]|uniref:PaaI family thioesterase n=1 Tax=Phyllobacterium sp. 628 TaxID=2718938 RepID=UPI0016623BD3|nr:PaaI family thioesterase [Phyllobacterium sp. 628]QND54425.1 PaaI family thioesterase [Phyllobacterium sp. 628]
MRSLAREWIDEILLRTPFARSLGIIFLSTHGDAVKMRLPVQGDVTQMPDNVHSGAIAAFIEISGSAAAVLGAGNLSIAGCATSQLNVTFLSLGDSRYLDANAAVVHRTATQAVVDVTVTSDDGRPIAKATTICRIFEKRAVAPAPPVSFFRPFVVKSSADQRNAR